MGDNKCKNCHEQTDENSSIKRSTPLATSTPISEGKSSFTFNDSSTESGSGANWWPGSDSEEIEESSNAGKFQAQSQRWLIESCCICVFFSCCIWLNALAHVNLFISFKTRLVIKPSDAPAESKEKWFNRFSKWVSVIFKCQMQKC